MWTTSSTVIIPTSRPGLIHHRGGDQRIFLEAQRHLLLVHVHRDQSLLALHHVGDRDLARRPEDPAQHAGADRMMARIDHVDFPEIRGERLARSQIIDHVAYGPMLWNRDQVALHQAAGRFLREGERFLDRRAVVGIERPEDGALLVLLHVLDDRDGIVGVELAGDDRDFVRLERIDQLVAHPVVHFREHVAVQEIRDRGREIAPLVPVDQLEQVGNVGRVERLDQRAHAFVSPASTRSSTIRTNSGFSRSSSSRRSSGASSKAPPGVSRSVSLIALSCLDAAGQRFLSRALGACRHL
jgi:hypothetical protein